MSHLFPVMAYHSDLTLKDFSRTVTGLPPHPSEGLLSAAASHLGAAGTGGREEILIVISPANDLWSIFRPEPLLGRKRTISLNREWATHFSRLDDPHHDVEEYAKPSPEAQMIIQPPFTQCRPPPSCSLSPVPSTRKHQWVIELFAENNPHHL